MNKWPSVYPRHLLGAAFDSAFNLRARFYFWARPQGRSIEGPGCLPGPLRASPPKQHVGEGALGSAEWWGAAHSAVGCQGCLSASLQFGTPSQGSPGRACDGLGHGQGVLSVAWQLPCPRLTAPWSMLRDVGSNPSWRQAAPSGACTHLAWDSATLGISAPAPPPEPMCGMQGGGVLSLINILEPGPAFSFFMPVG